MKGNLLASAPTLDGAKRQAGAYFYDPDFNTLRFHENGETVTLSNSRGPLNGYRIVKARCLREGKRKAERIIKAVMPGKASAAVLMVAMPLED